eukprot:s2538_g26.t1
MDQDQDHVMSHDNSMTTMIGPIADWAWTDRPTTDDSIDWTRLSTLDSWTLALAWPAVLDLDSWSLESGESGLDWLWTDRSPRLRLMILMTDDDSDD